MDTAVGGKQAWAGLPADLSTEARRAKVEAPKRKRARREGGSNSVVESQPSKLLVAGSIPVSRSNLRSHALERELRLASHSECAAADLSAVARSAKADVAQLAERVLGKDEVTSSILVIGSTKRRRREGCSASQVSSPGAETLRRAGRLGA